MKLLEKSEYSKVEELLKAYGLRDVMEEPYKIAMNEILNFFNENPYKDFLQIYYLDRYKYKNRYSSNRQMFRYLSKTLFLQEPTLYIMKKEIIYKSAMIFYKYNLIIGED